MGQGNAEGDGEGWNYLEYLDRWLRSVVCAIHQHAYFQSTTGTAAGTAAAGHVDGTATNTAACTASTRIWQIGTQVISYVKPQYRLHLGNSDLALHISRFNQCNAMLLTFQIIFLTLLKLKQENN